MEVKRYFLGWDAPVTDKVCDFLLSEHADGVTDLHELLIVAPTRQAGRRLREALAVRSAEHGIALRPPRIVTPAFFVGREDESEAVANPVEVVAVWAELLKGIDPERYPGLFPAPLADQDLYWALGIGRMIQQFRETLVDGGYCIAEVVRRFEDSLGEPERWRDLAQLEAAYLERLSARGLRDPCAHMVRQAKRPVVPDGITGIILAVLPDPTPLMIQAVPNLEERVTTAILIHAPEALAAAFDEWGRPLPAAWNDRTIDIPDDAINLSQAASPVSQSRTALAFIASETERFGPLDIAIGVPDQHVIPFLSADLEARALPAFNPAGKRIEEHPLYGLLSLFRSLVTDKSVEAFRSLLRHPDLLTRLEAKHGVNTRVLLEEWDLFQNERLPQEWEDIERGVSGMSRRRSKAPPADPSISEGIEGDAPCGRVFGETLAAAVGFIREQLGGFERHGVVDAVRGLLQEVYAGRVVHPRRPAGEEFIAAAGAITGVLQACKRLDDEAGLKKQELLEIAIRELGTQRYYPSHAGTVIDLEGWLELPWNDAPFLIVTGMNDGLVPAGRIEDIFLPDSLRARLRLRHDTDRFARDAYVMSGLIESRRAQGRVAFIVGKTNSVGEVLRPSRLLFRCADAALPGRARRLFGVPPAIQDNAPARISFALDTRPPPDVPAERLRLGEMHVTAFRDYLACPFRFYLGHVLEMEEIDDEKWELDALDFGVLIHHALQMLSEDDEMRRCDNPHKLQRFLRARAEEWVARRFGAPPPLQVWIQLESACQRLHAAADLQAEWTRQGWEIVASELGVEGSIGGMLVRGKVDRIDRHRESGLLRVLDYKTSDRAVLPERCHVRSATGEERGYARVKVAGGEYAWADLQLPLYRLLLEETPYGGGVEWGYCNLPKAVSDTGWAPWADFDDALLGAARRCAEGVIGDIQNGRFWPAADGLPYDDFESLFHADVNACVDGEAFAKFLNQLRL